MINASNDFKNKLLEPSRHFIGRIRHAGETVDCDIKSITVHKGACGDDTLTIGSVYSSYAEITVSGLGDALENEDIELQIGMDISGTTEYITIGNVTVSKVKSSVYESQLTANGFITSKLSTDLPTLPAQTIPAIITAIESATGLSITLFGMTAAGTITEPLTAMTCREALSLVTFLLGGYATEMADGNIRISKYELASEKLAVNGDRMLSAPTFADNEFSMTGVKVVVSPESNDEDGEIIPEVYYETSTTVRQIYENKYMTQALFNVFAANVTGYTYMPGEIGLSLGDPRLEPWDCLLVTDNAGETFSVPCLQIVHTFNGGFSSEITAAGAALSDTEVQGSITKQLGQVNSELIKAQGSSAKALTAAQDAQASANEASAAAASAVASAEDAKETAEAVHDMAEQAQQDANTAKTQAASATASANEAKTQAQAATQSANAALSQLGLVESVIDTVNWFAEHKKASTDTTVDATKDYYTWNPTTGALAKVTPVGTENPSQEGWYELSEAISSYVATHVATTDDGLFVMDIIGGWKVLVSSGGGGYAAGVYIVDPSGNTAQATTASGITHDPNKTFYIGDENAYILFDGNGHISISGSGITFESKSLSEVLADIASAQQIADEALNAVENIDFNDLPLYWSEEIYTTTTENDYPILIDGEQIENSNGQPLYWDASKYSLVDGELITPYCSFLETDYPVTSGVDEDGDPAPVLSHNLAYEATARDIRVDELEDSTNERTSALESVTGDLAIKANDAEAALDKMGETIDGISSSVESSIGNVKTELSDQKTLIDETAKLLNTYSGYISIVPIDPSITVAANDSSYVRIVPNKVSLVNENNETAYLSGQRLYAPSAVVTNLYMQTINAETGQTVGGAGWVMRSNGHLSLRPMR